MTSALLHYGSRKLFAGVLEQKKKNSVGGNDVRRLRADGLSAEQNLLTTDLQDPYFEMVVNEKGKLEKAKRQIPDFIPEHDAKVLYEVKKKAYRMDMEFSAFGKRFGLDAIIGFCLPEVGDFICAAIAWRLVQRCNKIEGGLPAAIRAQMVYHVIIDLLLGLIPFVGDILDSLYRCNTKNVMLLEQHLRTKHNPGSTKKKRWSAGLERFEGGKDQFAKNPMPVENVKPHSHDWDDTFKDKDTKVGTGNTAQQAHDEPSTQQGKQSTKGRWNFFRASQRERQTDAEMGAPQPGTH